jgi:CDP-glycerol glycerophosphotransferase (TagB/SpsB family)/glycosyltransferase involved in cell wall biosynthesis
VPVLLSIVVPVYNVQAYLRECLASILDQGFDDLEVVAVNDCSPDHGGAILDEIAARDSRVRVLHLEENVGLGLARNAGYEKSRGDYVLFLDSDDTMTPGSLQAISEQLRAMEYPEMLIVDHARAYWWGKVERNIRHRVMEELSTEPFTAEEHPEVLEFLQVAWNKVCRRDFLERENLAFPTGYYEDTPWTHKAFFTARTIATLPVVCVLYRQRRHGNILGTRSNRHFEAFDQWQQVVDFLDSRPDLEHWREAVIERMARHYITVLRHPHRLSPEDRGRFIKEASEQLRRVGPAHPFYASTRKDLYTHRLLYRGDIHSFDYFTRAVRLRVKARKKTRTTVKRLRRLRSRGKTALKLMEYSRLQDKPLDENLAVFASLWNRSVGGNPAAIYEAMKQHAPHIHGVWIIRKDQRRHVPDGVDYVVPGMRRYWQVMARAKYFINDVNFPDDVVKRPGQIHVQTQHGTPLKHMGLDLMSHPAASKGMVFRNLLKRSDRWDYNLSSNRFSTIVWERAFPSNFTTLESGYPRNDRLVTATAEEVTAARIELGIPAGKKAILFAPTHRDHDKHFIIRADLRRLAEELGPDYVLMVRAHYFYRWMPDLDLLESEGLILNVSRHPDVERLMLASDALVTDYSSIMFDFANLDRPIVVFAPDWDTYRDVRGTYFDIFEKSPGLTLATQSAVAEAFVSGRHDDDAARMARRRFREEFCEFDDGNAAERVVRTVMLNEERLPLLPLEDRPSIPRPADLVYELPPVEEATEFLQPDSPESLVEHHLTEQEDPVATGQEDSATAADPELRSKVLTPPSP